MRRFLLAITFACIILTPQTTYANELPSLSTPAKVILGAFSLVMFVLPGDAGTIGYRFAMLSPLAAMSAGAATAAWGAMRLIIKHSSGDPLMVF